MTNHVFLTWNHTGTESSVSHFHLGGPLWLPWTHQVNFPSQGQLSSSLNSFHPHIYSVYNLKPPLLLMVTYSQVPGISTRALLGVVILSTAQEYLPGSNSGNVNFCCSLLFIHSVMFDSLQPRGLHHTRLPCPSPSPRACSHSCSFSQSCHPTISFSIVPFSTHVHWVGDAIQPSCPLSSPSPPAFNLSQH